MNTLPPRVAEIVASVAEQHGLQPSEILGKSNKAEIVAARKVAVRRVRFELNLSVNWIARLFGKSHGSISQYLRQPTPASPATYDGPDESGVWAIC